MLSGKSKKTQTKLALESLEGRQYFTLPWGDYEKILGLDKVLATYPQLNGAGESIAIIDSGADYHNSAFGDPVIGPGHKFIYGYDFQDNDTDPMVVDNAHGTGVAGIIGAAGYDFNGTHHQGYASKVGMILLRQESSTNAKKALDWVIANHTQYNIVAVNLTDFVGSSFFPTVYQSELTTLHNLGILVIAPVGNQGASFPIENPAHNPYVYGVGAVDTSDALYSESQRGVDMDMLGPGVKVTIPYYDVNTGKSIITNYATGTSWSAANVSGAALLIKQIDPNFTPEMIMSILEDSGKPIYDPISNLTYPRLDVWAAVNLAFQRAGSNIPGAFMNSPATIAGTGSSVIEAENYDNGGEGVAYHDSDVLNQGGSYRPGGVDIETTADNGTKGYDVGFIQAGEWMKYTVYVAKSGTYTIDFRVASAGAGGTFHLTMNDGAVSDKTGELTIGNTGGWSNWQTISKTGVHLTAGVHIMKLIFDSNGSTGGVGNINSVTFTPTAVDAGNPVSTGYTGAPVNVAYNASTVIQAEDYDNGGEGVAYHDLETANLGGVDRLYEGVDLVNTTDGGAGFALGYTEAGEWINYSINVARAGTYNLSFRVASVGLGGAFHVDTTVKGVTTNLTGTLTAPDTTGWDTYQTVTKTVKLTAGSQILKLTFDGNGANGGIANFNYLELDPAQVPQVPTSTPFSGSPIKVTRGKVTTIQAENFDNGGEAVGYHDSDSTNAGGKFRKGGVDIITSTDTGGGYAIGYTKKGEWMKYSTDVTTTGTYKLSIRVASKGLGGTFHFEVDGVNVTGTMRVPNTGSGQTWQTLTKNINLKAGNHVMRLVMDSVGANGYTGNFNWLKLS